MKILQVLGGGKWGGGCVVVRSYVAELIARGNEVWVVCLDDGVARKFAEVGAKPIRSPFWFHPINPFDLFPFLQLWWLCRRERFDLVATHTSKGGILGRFAATLAGIPRIVHHAHGFAFRETQKPWIRRCYIIFERIAARACDLIISVSEDHRQKGIQEGVAPAGKIVTVLNGIETGRFGRTSAPDARRMLGLETGDVLIGVASRLAPKKGVGDLIQAFPIVHRRFPNTRLVLLGEGPARAELERQAQASGLGDRIHFTGFRDNVPDLLSAFDIVVQPSISEGLSISVLEGLAAGKPTLACDIEGNREILRTGRNGLLVPPSDPASLAAAICSLIEDPQYAGELGLAAQADCRERFSQTRMIEQILDVYRKLASKTVPAAWAVSCPTQK
jgi:glycosyltransferase involved in cell wall biosynthesis